MAATTLAGPIARKLGYGRVDESAAGLDDFGMINARHWRGYCLWAPPFYDPRRLGGVVKDLDRAVARAAREPRTLAWRGRAKRILGDWKGAWTDLERARGLAPRDGYVRACLAELRRARG